MKQILFAYIPVLHRGYQEFFDKYKGAELYLLDREELSSFEELDYLKKDIRVLDLALTESAIKSWNIFNVVKSIKISEIDEKIYSDKRDDGDTKSPHFIFTNDDIGHFIANKFFASVEEKFFEPIFLRWDKNLMSEAREVPVGVRLSKNDFEKQLMRDAFFEAGKSSDWWRHVGGLIVKDGKIVLLGYNEHMPTPDQQYKNSDPRISFTSGVGGDLSSSIHAEAKLIALAAARGISLAGAELYATTFPCPPCAKQVVFAGIKKVYYAKGYALFDGLEILQSAGVEVVLIDFTLEELHELERLEQSRSKVKDCSIFSLVLKHYSILGHC